MAISWIYKVWILLLPIFDSAVSSYSEDQCSWRGSGLSQQPGSVEQISLHCSEGALDWLYPKGALRLTLSPRLTSAAVGPGGSSSGLITACVKPSEHFHGAQLYLERDGVLELLVGDRLETSPPPRVRCFSRLPGEKVALFLQATPHQDISRRIASFRYELRGDWTARLSLDSNPIISNEGACRPCNNTELLMAVCTSDFVVRGNIKAVDEDSELRAAVIKVSATRVFRQKYTLFTGTGRLTRTGEIRTLLQCGVRPGVGSFLFTGRVHFGEAWLGCAPRYKDFLQAYAQAKLAQQLPCEMAVD
ncbi:meteorin [Oncorhynchus nerka]|uniref:Meteorin, glial cell differentiation regulator n=3 Tax=Oncorhynchus TaxID=8016 RepID=A0A8C7HQR6_ONCKI|nr:meteorin [Oncorhynchus kisutch]XP_021420875.1 meteorin [Oncorhynchus mykiss]XP_024242637.1 meteorin [Oncorhynchus tshawytscha]XP_029485315.1 meteorin [Oncorhynchus nerka]XP_055779930.1 meteorin [Salvelinus fontinalis]